MYRITQLGRRFGLSRSTLLYYDRIGLLSPSGRSEAGYRVYSEADSDRLAAIASFRRAGLSVDDIRRVLAKTEGSGKTVLERRLKAVGEEIESLRAQQHLIAGMLKVQATEELPATVDKETWVAMLRAAGMDDRAMARWHTEFERRAPEAHHAFLLSLGITDHEALLIRRWSAAGAEPADGG